MGDEDAAGQKGYAKLLGKRMIEEGSGLTEEFFDEIVTALPGTYTHLASSNYMQLNAKMIIVPKMHRFNAVIVF